MRWKFEAYCRKRRLPPFSNPVHIGQYLRSLFRKPKIPKPVFQLEATGFSATMETKVLFTINWADVREVVAFKEDVFAYDIICIGFRISETDSYYSIGEDFIHYEQLLEELPQRFPGIRTDWYKEVVLPPFTPNGTTL